MQASQKRFIARILTVVMGIVTLIALETVVSGTIGVLSGLMLLIASCTVTHTLWQLSLRRLPQRRRTAAPAQHKLTPIIHPRPVLQVVKTFNRNTNTHTPHVA